MIQFLLNQELQQEDNLDPNLTVLNYLRENLGKTGSKEGCASGDCGACTVVIAELVNNKLAYQSLNSCLTFVAALHGKQLITVEGLQHKNQLHSTQQAMADCHGSQCGFCTPGFVMSLFALQKNSVSYDKACTVEALSGNLCRCTGYQPIYQAAEKVCNHQHKKDQFDALETETIQRLQAIQSEDNTNLIHDSKQCFLPTSTQELADLYNAHPEAHLFAGGTDLALEVTQFHRPLTTTIYLGNVKEMQSIKVTEESLILGATASLTQCYQTLKNEYSDFGELLHRFASLQIRNQGTLGGNIANASPIGDAPPLLIALNAQVQLRQGNTVRIMPLEEFFLAYKKTIRQSSEFIEKIIVPRASVNKAARFKAYKISKRLDDDISAVCGAFNICIENNIITDVRIAFGGMAAIPKRATHCEQALINQSIHQKKDGKTAEEIIKKACLALHNDFTPLSDFRASQEYRTLIAQNLVRKYFLEIENDASDTQHTYLATRVTAYV